MRISLGLFILRLAVGIIFIKHGWPKMKNPEGVASSMGWKSWRVAFLGFVECLSGLALILGFQVQIAALLLSIVMLGAIYYKIFKWHAPFSGNGGWEFDLILLASNVAIFLIGGGFWVLF